MIRQKWLVPFLQFAFLCCVCPRFANAGAGKTIEETEGFRVILFFFAFIVVSILIEVDIGTYNCRFLYKSNFALTKTENFS